MKSVGYTREELFKELADMIIGIKREEEMPIGYCFSYPAESVPVETPNCYAGQKE